MEEEYTVSVVINIKTKVDSWSGKTHDHQCYMNTTLCDLQQFLCVLECSSSIVEYSVTKTIGLPNLQKIYRFKKQDLKLSSDSIDLPKFSKR